MIHDEIVGYDVAKLAKEKGFDVPTFGYYRIDTNDWYRTDVYDDWNDSTIRYSAPTQSQLQRWLREKGFGEVEVRHWPETNKYPHHYGWDVKDNLGDLMSYSSKMFDTYELALEDALAYSLKNLV